MDTCAAAVFTFVDGGSENPPPSCMGPRKGPLFYLSLSTAAHGRAVPVRWPHFLKFMFRIC